MSAAPTMTLDEAAERYPRAELRRAARWALWRQGDLRYLLHEGRDPSDPVVERYVPANLRGTTPRGQLHAYEAIERARAEEADTFVVKTGRQYGKSLLFTTIVVSMCIRSIIDGTEAVRIPYAAPDAKQVDQFITPHFQRLQRHAPPELCPEYVGSKRTWVAPDGTKSVIPGGSWFFPANGSMVVVAGCDDMGKADALRGPRAHMAVVDEAGFIGIVDYVIESVLGWQLATTGGLLLVSSTPPVSMDHGFVALWDRALADGYAFESTTPEAPHMTPKLLNKAIKRCGGEHTIAWKREGLGQLIADPDKVVLPEVVEHYDLVVREHERPRHFLPHVIGDGGHEDLAIYLFGYYDFATDTDVIEDEVVMRRARSDEHDAAVAAKERELWGDRKVWRRKVDAPPQTRADLSRPEWQSGEDGERRWLGVSKPPSQLGSFNAGVNEVRVRAQRGRLAIHPRCTTTIAHARGAQWDKARRSLLRVKDSQGDTLHHYDGCASLVYFVRDLDRHTNPFPALEGIGAADHHIGPHAARPAEAAVLERLVYGRRGR